MLTCQELTELITDYVEGRMSFTDRLRFQLHLGMCSHCRRYLKQVQLTVRCLGKLPVSPPPDPIRQELMSRFRSWALVSNNDARQA